MSEPMSAIVRGLQRGRDALEFLRRTVEAAPMC